MPYLLLYALYKLEPFILTSQTFLMHVIPLMVYLGNDLGGGLSQSDSLLTHALIGIPGIPWQITLAIIAQFVFALSNNDILLSYRISLSVLMTCKTC